MFVGHYAVSFYLKAREPSIPLWILVLAVQWVDVLWAFLVLAGVEDLAMVPGITRASPLDLRYVPYTHSLAAVVGWSLLAAWAWYRVRPGRSGRARAALVVGVAVLSHWIADVLVHRPDLPLYDNSHKVGLGLWNYPLVSFPLEIGLLAAGMWYWFRTDPARVKGRNLMLLGIVMLISQVMTNFGPVPAAPASFVVLALVFYAGYTLGSVACESAPAAGSA